MIRLTVRHIAETTGARLISDDPHETIKAFSIDTRTIKPDDFFIAIKGKNFDGHDFVKQAAGKGAKGLIVRRGTERRFKNLVKHLIIVEDPIEAMAMIAARIRREVDIPAICISGTNGKTTVKEILSHILSSRFKVLKSVKSYNNIIGLSLTLFNLDASYDLLVLELGTNHPGEISKLAWIARANMAIITNIGSGHLEFFIDKKRIFREKTSLLKFLPQTGIAFINKDDELLSQIATSGVLKKFYGKHEDSDFLISNVSRRDNGYDFALNDNKFFIPLEGEHNVYNAACAIAATEYLDMDYEEIRKSLSTVSLPEMRLERVNIGEITFINDSYNANPDSFNCALKVLGESEAKGKKGVVAGAMMELGERSSDFHRILGKSIAEKDLDFVIVIGDAAKGIIEGARSSGMNEEDAFFAKSYEDAARVLRNKAVAGSVVLIKGSRSTKMEEVIKCFTTSYIH